MPSRMSRLLIKTILFAIIGLSFMAEQVQAQDDDAGEITNNILQLFIIRQQKRGKMQPNIVLMFFAAITIQPENTTDTLSTNGTIYEPDSNVTKSAPVEGNSTIHADETLNSTADNSTFSNSTAASGRNSTENGTDSVTNDMTYNVNGTNSTTTSSNTTEIGTNSTLKDTNSTMNDAASTMNDAASTMNDAASTMNVMDSNTNGTDSSYPGTNSTIAPDQNADINTTTAVPNAELTSTKNDTDTSVPSTTEVS